MTADEIAIKLTARVEFMILQYAPKPTCVDKQKNHAALVKEIKDIIASRLSSNTGINIEIKV